MSAGHLSAVVGLATLFACSEELPPLPPTGWIPTGCWEVEAPDDGMLFFSPSPDSVALFEDLDARAAELGFSGFNVMRPVRPFTNPLDSVLMAQFWDYDRVEGRIKLTRTSGTFGFEANVRYASPDLLTGSGVRFIDVIPPEGFVDIAITARKFDCPPL